VARTLVIQAFFRFSGLGERVADEVRAQAYIGLDEFVQHRAQLLDQSGVLGVDEHGDSPDDRYVELRCSSTGTLFIYKENSAQFARKHEGLRFASSQLASANQLLNSQCVLGLLDPQPQCLSQLACTDAAACDFRVYGGRDDDLAEEGCEQVKPADARQCDQWACVGDWMLFRRRCALATSTCWRSSSSVASRYGTSCWASSSMKSQREIPSFSAAHALDASPRRKSSISTSSSIARCTSRRVAPRVSTTSQGNETVTECVGSAWPARLRDIDRVYRWHDVVGDMHDTASLLTLHWVLT
jgi:hypothetical protein